MLSHASRLNVHFTPLSRLTLAEIVNERDHVHLGSIGESKSREFGGLEGVNEVRIFAVRIAGVDKVVETFEGFKDCEPSVVEAEPFCVLQTTRRRLLRTHARTQPPTICSTNWTVCRRCCVK